MTRRRAVHCSPELMERLLARIAEGETLTSLGASGDFPTRDKTLAWLKARPAMKARYDAACAGRTRVMRRWPRKTGPRELKDLYSEELAWRICEGVWNGLSVKQALAGPGMPVDRTVYVWLERYPEFARMFTWALFLREQILADEIGAIADALVAPEWERTGRLTPDGPLLTAKERRELIRIEKARIDRAEAMMNARMMRMGSLTPHRYRWA